jgi:hypothetical protein
MPTDIERSCEEHGFRLPEDPIWEIVAEQPARWAIGDICVPVGVALGCLAWGVPYNGGVSPGRP